MVEEIAGTIRNHLYVFITVHHGGIAKMKLSVIYKMLNC